MVAFFVLNIGFFSTARNSSESIKREMIKRSPHLEKHCSLRAVGLIFSLKVPYNFIALCVPSLFICRNASG